MKLNLVMLFLRNELRSWKQSYKNERLYFKGDMDCKLAKKVFKEHQNHIAEFTVAIKILDKTKFHNERK